MLAASPRPFALFLLNFFYVFIQVNKSGTFALHKFRRIIPKGKSIFFSFFLNGFGNREMIAITNYKDDLVFISNSSLIKIFQNFFIKSRIYSLFFVVSAQVRTLQLFSLKIVYFQSNRLIFSTNLRFFFWPRAS